MPFIITAITSVFMFLFTLAGSIVYSIAFALMWPVATLSGIEIPPCSMGCFWSGN